MGLSDYTDIYTGRHCLGMKGVVSFGSPEQIKAWEAGMRFTAMICGNEI